MDLIYMTPVALQLRGRRSQSCRLGFVYLDQLPHPEIQQDILRASWDPGAGDLAVDHLSERALAAAGVPIAAEQQHGGVGALFEDDASLGLEHGREAAQLAVRVLLGHARHLVGELLDPSPLALEQGARLGEAVPHDGLVHQRLPEGLALHHVFEGGREGDARRPRYAHGDGQALVVEIGHDVSHAHTLLADEVGDGHLDVV